MTDDDTHDRETLAALERETGIQFAGVTLDRATSLANFLREQGDQDAADRLDRFISAMRDLGDECPMLFAVLAREASQCIVRRGGGDSRADQQ